MSPDTPESSVERLWNRLEERYDADDVACDCGIGAGAVDALERSGLSRADVEAYRRGDRPMADLIAAVDHDLDPAAIDDLAALASACERALDGPESETDRGGPRADRPEADDGAGTRSR